ncbi:hypothetical protein H6G54_21230 [Anabaena cylindrica FACHB-243]|uniref:Uncharacterized protein n=1 Tax=Anabaena cylindrica (strain ATCC 27899 / PCC 7122) TaxID=272123 RepID=K9ZS14_ANACC|nr:MULTISPECIES: hypothetical protein [Anabaena]AFZ61312.1 hypothetical protein Anacy_6034 [Anabaena cylindrica PCC 7122]MBD2420180.1 hypothetical protein [Anabaena cylindrica FACHB-243]MBY5282193.1 hypothetical protein [Anabaena sp. CCAP 1446/1C]MBY5309450.1 hypothetical protein [Anabaena sp. CCAP 1446/1C]MCM2409253.1 hypothetical protein [Anabaena sp. CCAP 1446/1C]
MSQPLENLEPQQPNVNSEQEADNSTTNNKIQGDHNRTIQGNDNKAVIGDSNTVNYVSDKKNLFQIGRNYIRHIQVNILSGNWGNAIVALSPFLVLSILSGGIGFGGGVTVQDSRITNELKTAKENVIKANSEISELKERILNQTSLLKQIDDLKNQLTANRNSLNEAQRNLRITETQKIGLEKQINNLNRELIAIKKRLDGDKRSSISPSNQNGNLLGQTPLLKKSKSDCLRLTEMIEHFAKLGASTSSMKEEFKEWNCSQWGISSP